ncbi:MAG: M12 family metallo-peptidase [Cocleimonas sp.]
MNSRFIGLLLFLTVSFANASDYELLIDSSPSHRAEIQNKLAKNDTNTLNTKVTVNSDIQHAVIGDSISFKNQGKNYHITIEKKITHSNNDTSLIGYIDNAENRVIITKGSNGSNAIINTADGLFKIEIKNNEEHLLTPDKLKSYIAAGNENDGIIPDISRIENTQNDDERSFPTANAAPVGVATIDIMVLYTPELVSSLGSVSAVQSRINQLISVTNTSYTDSEMSMQLNLVHSEEIDADNDSSSGAALAQMQSGSGVFSNVDALRTSKGADLVVLMRDFKQLHSGSCGIAYILGNAATGTMPNSDKAYGYSIVQNGDYTVGNSIFFCSDYSFAHEVGHNFGFAHDRDHAGSGGIFDYSYGHDDGSGTFATVMSYDRPQAGKFSNPNIDCNGSPCGIVEGLANSANNAKSGNEVRFDIAGFYAPVVNPQDSNAIILIIQMLLLDQ